MKLRCQQQEEISYVDIRPPHDDSHRCQQIEDDALVSTSIRLFITHFVISTNFSPLKHILCRMTLNLTPFVSAEVKPPRTRQVASKRPPSICNSKQGPAVETPQEGDPPTAATTKGCLLSQKQGTKLGGRWWWRWCVGRRGDGGCGVVVVAWSGERVKGV